MPSRPAVIFNCSDVNEACAQALANGSGLGEVFSIGKSARGGANGTKFFDLYAKVGGQYGRLLVRVLNELHVGTIDPLDDDEVARINASRSGKFGAVKKRDREAMLKVQKYNVYVETDDFGRPKGELPGPEHESQYYKMMYYLDQFFYDEMTARLEAKALVVAGRGKAPENAIVIANAKITSPCQTAVSSEAATNPGAELANPMCRTKIKFDKETGLLQKNRDGTQRFIYDFSTKYKDPANPRASCFELLKFDGHPVNAHNVHHIPSRTRFDGLISIDSVCSSQMGLSIMVEMSMLVVSLPVATSLDVSDIYGDNVSDDEDAPPHPVSAPVPPAASAAEAPAAGTPAPACESVAVSEDDLTDAINDLGLAGNVD